MSLKEQAKTTAWIYQQYNECHYDKVHGGQMWVSESYFDEQLKIQQEAFAKQIGYLKQDFEAAKKEIHQLEKTLEYATSQGMELAEKVVVFQQWLEERQPQSSREAYEKFVEVFQVPQEQGEKK